MVVLENKNYICRTYFHASGKTKRKRRGASVVNNARFAGVAELADAWDFDVFYPCKYGYCYAIIAESA